MTIAVDLGHKATKQTNKHVMISMKRIHYLCEGGIEKSVPHDHRFSSLGKPSDLVVMQMMILGTDFSIPPSHS